MPVAVTDGVSGSALTVASTLSDSMVGSSVFTPSTFGSSRGVVAVVVAAVELIEPKAASTEACGSGSFGVIGSGIFLKR